MEKSKKNSCNLALTKAKNVSSQFLPSNTKILFFIK